METVFKFNNKFLKIITEASINPANHRKCENILLRLYETMDFAKFVENFMGVLHRCFRHPISQPCSEVDNIIQFTSRMVANIASKYEQDMEKEETHPLLETIIYEVLKFTNLDYEETRLRSCRFICLTLRQIGGSVYLNNELCDRIQNVLLDRLSDRKSFVREEVVLGLSRLQDPHLDECPVIRAFLDRILDISAAVRKSIITYIAVTPDTTVALITRCKDVDKDVRAKIYLKFSEWPQFLSSDQKLELIENGLEETDTNVMKMFKNILLIKWLAYYDGDMGKLLKSLSYEPTEEGYKKYFKVCENVSKTILPLLQLENIRESFVFNANKVLVDVSIQNVILWQNFHKIILDSKNDDKLDLLEDIFPELQTFCNFISEFIKSNIEQNGNPFEFEKIVQQLLIMAERFDFAEEVGRQALLDLLKDILVSNYAFELMFPNVISIWLKIENNVTTVCENIVEVINTIREDRLMAVKVVSKEKEAEFNFKVAKIQFMLNELEQEMEDAIANKNYQLASETSKKLKKMKEDMILFQSNKEQEICVEKFESNTEHKNILRSLNILCAILSNERVTKVNLPLDSLKTGFLDLCDETPSKDVYSKVFQCHILYALLDPQYAKEKLQIFVTPIIVHCVTGTSIKPILINALKAISDLLLLQRHTLFPKKDNIFEETNIYEIKQNIRRKQIFQNYDHQSDKLSLAIVVESIIFLLQDDDRDIRETVASVLVQLVANRIVTAPSFLVQMMLKWFNPSTEIADPKVGQLFGGLFTLLSYDNSGLERTLQLVVITLLDIIANAPKAHPLSSVKWKQLVLILAGITQGSTSCCHEEMAISLCSMIKSTIGKLNCTQLYSSMLLALHFESMDSKIIRKLSKLVRELSLIVHDNTSEKLLIQCKKKLTSLKNNMGNGDETLQESNNTKEMDANTINTSVRESFNSNKTLLDKSDEENVDSSNICSSNDGSNKNTQNSKSLLSVQTSNLGISEVEDSCNGRKSYDSFASTRNGILCSTMMGDRPRQNRSLKRISEESDNDDRHKRKR